MTATDTRLRTNELRRLYDEVIAAKKRLTDAQRALPPEPVQDWELRRTDGTPVRLSELFAEHNDLVVVHNMGAGCNHCTLWADGFRGYHDHIARRCAFVLCSNDEPAAAKAFAEQRGWNFPVVSGARSDFKAAMGFASPEGKPWPGVSAFHKHADGTIIRTGSAPWGPGDDYCLVWPLFDLLADGPDGWEPR